ncbi:hypothetical protein GQ607_013488 [Colletotrichum asianum]|uniref:Uncharacterized protein n=1 Tax=Colletotrichum asianum TaxID=702518 RepID=A0A8H3ZGV2_9PEZI|nr:hypothetical protein GQ607_013488 [Colletotrichum asianum]
MNPAGDVGGIGWDIIPLSFSYFPTQGEPQKSVEHTALPSGAGHGSDRVDRQGKPKPRKSQDAIEIELPEVAVLPSAHDSRAQQCFLPSLAKVLGKKLRSHAAEGRERSICASRPPQQLAEREDGSSQGHGCDPIATAKTSARRHPNEEGQPTRSTCATGVQNLKLEPFNESGASLLNWGVSSMEPPAAGPD